MNERQSFRPNQKIWMSAAEAATFKAMRSAGHVSFFRTAACKGCTAEVAKGKKYCSKRCYDDKRKRRKSGGK